MDAIFVGVEYIDLPTKMVELAITTPTEAERAAVRARLKKEVGPSNLFILETTGIRYFVVAVAMKVMENELDIFESSLEKF
jgi:hypothetical protein